MQQNQREDYILPLRSTLSGLMCALATVEELQGEIKLQTNMFKSHSAACGMYGQSAHPACSLLPQINT